MTEKSVIKLNRGSVFKDVDPFGLESHHVLGNPIVTHFRVGIPNETGVQASHEAQAIDGSDGTTRPEMVLEHTISHP